VTVEGPALDTELLVIGPTAVELLSEADGVEMTTVDVLAGMVLYKVEVSVKTDVVELTIVVDDPDVLITLVTGQTEVVV
jgi:hypothetical protein